MLDMFGRDIDYLRISVTDRCNLRCLYCMPKEGIPLLGHEDILRYEEIVVLAKIFARLGIRKIRLTGGEPLVRKDIYNLVRDLKSVEGIDIVALTTNGILLKDQLSHLVESGLDAVNISIDAIDSKSFLGMARKDEVARVIESVDAAISYPNLKVKLNCVPTKTNANQIQKLADFALERGLPLRFIELMPIGEGVELEPLSEEEVRDILGDMTVIESYDKRDKCRHFITNKGCNIGFISALSHKFCSSCNRVRLTADGFLKTCLQYDAGISLKPLLTCDDVIEKAIVNAIHLKPKSHHFGTCYVQGDELRRMSQIGG